MLIWDICQQQSEEFTSFSWKSWNDIHDVTTKAKFSYKKHGLFWLPFGIVQSRLTSFTTALLIYSFFATLLCSYIPLFLDKVWFKFGEFRCSIYFSDYLSWRIVWVLLWWKPKNILLLSRFNSLFRNELLFQNMWLFHVSCTTW